MLIDDVGYTMKRKLRVNFLAVALFCLISHICLAKRTICLPQSIRNDVTILGGIDAGNFKKLGTKIQDMTECLKKACRSQQGNIAFLFQNTCYSVACYKLYSCELEPAENTGVQTAGALYRIIAAYPEFKSDRSVDVLEDTPLLREIFRFEATAESRNTDRTMTETMNFEILRGNIHKTFRLFPESSNWGSSIRLLQPLDRENISAYELQIQATNKVENVSSLLNISINILDSNDNPPEFLEVPFIFSVFSNSSVGSLIGRLVAKDNDIGANAKLEYGIDLKQESLIIYDKKTGDVRLAQKEKIDTVKTFDYDITVTDGLYTSKGRLKVVLYPNNRNKPIFKQTSYELRLNGQVPLDTEVVRVTATDPDFGKLGELTYMILNGDPEGIFTITNEGLIRTWASIPSTSEIYNLTIGCHDNGYPELHAVRPASIVISLQWLRFKQDIYDVNVYESLGLLDTVFRASASFWVGGIEVMAGRRTRTMSGINYYLDGGEEKFEMEETSGVVKLHEVLDYESKKDYILELKADYESSDSTAIRTVLSAKAILRVAVLDVNDNAPKFSQLLYTQDVWKSMSISSPVLKINATDADTGRNGRIHFETIAGNVNDTFAFEPDGMVFLRKSLLTSEVSTFNITVLAWDSGEPDSLQSEQSASVIINVQGSVKSPKFSRDSYNLVILESVKPDFLVYQLNASVTDPKWKVTYWFRTLGEKIPFSVKPDSGWIFTTDRLDREKKAVYELTYMATAERDETTCTTMVNVIITLMDDNDNRPLFTQAYYATVITSQKLGMSVLTVRAIDKDSRENGRVTYNIVKGHDEHYFTIDSRNGKITTRRVLPSTSLLALKIYVSARDHGKQALSSLKPVPVFVLIGSIFPIKVRRLQRTTTTMRLRFTLVNVSLEHISHIGVVVQEADSIEDYKEFTNRDIVSWYFVHNFRDNGAYAQRYFTGEVTCTHQIRKKKSFDFTVGSDGNRCTSNKQKFCNGKLQAKKSYRFQLVAYFNNETSPENITSVESTITSVHKTGAENAKRTAGFRSWRYDIIVIILGVIVGLIILATIIRAFILYRRDKYSMKSEEEKDGISYPLSNARYRRSGTPRSSRSTMSFAELSKSRRLDKKMDKVSSCETDEEQQNEPEEDAGADQEMETELST